MFFARTVDQRRFYFCFVRNVGVKAINVITLTGLLIPFKDSSNSVCVEFDVRIVSETPMPYVTYNFLDFLLSRTINCDIFPTTVQLLFERLYKFVLHINIHYSHC